MMVNNKFAQQFTAYSDWRRTLTQSIEEYRAWLNEEELSDAQIEQRIAYLLERLAEDKLNVAFVAEFSRGKSELINAIFFATYGMRLLPSSAGRTTMCPTELLYDKTKPSSIQLLPIETRLTDTSTTEYKRYADEWKTIEFDVESNASMIKAFSEVSQTKTVTLEVAENLELFDPDSADDAMSINSNGEIEVPSWRYAMINFPHPLLEDGLVILDTPGLNAIGTEPELTLNMLPNAHAVLFILAADTGVTKSEIDIWRQYISGTRFKQKGRLAVLNKIDGLWDELKNEADVEREIDKQVTTSAELLGLEKNQIFPISAQKGLLAKVNNEADLLDKSRILELEKALSDELIPSKKEIVRENTQNEIEDLLGNTQMILEARLTGVKDQMQELSGLRGKNDDVIEHMMNKVKVDKTSFEKGLKQFQALRSVYSQHTNKLFNVLGMLAIKKHVNGTRKEMIDATFTISLRKSMDGFFEELKGRLAASESQVDEIKKMMDVMYDKFAKEHGLRKTVPTTFSILRYQKELGKLERAYREQFNTPINMIANEKVTLTTKFFETLASRVVHVFEVFNRDVENWLRSVIAPMESQVREHQLQLRRRLESIKRIYKATDTLEERIKELDVIEKNINHQLEGLNGLRFNIKSVLAIESFDYASAQAEAAPIEVPAEKIDLVLEAEPVLVEDSVIVRPEGSKAPVGETIEVVDAEPVPVENNVLKFH
jgi:hypothetical protein